MKMVPSRRQPKSADTSLQGRSTTSWMRKQRAIVAILEGKRLNIVAKEVGVEQATLSQWLTQDDFQRALRDAANRMFQTSIGKLAAVSDEATAALIRGMSCGNPNTEVRAALGYFQLMLNPALSRQDEIAEARELIEVVGRVLNQVDPSIKKKIGEQLQKERDKPLWLGEPLNIDDEIPPPLDFTD